MLHKDVALQLFCLCLKVRFGIHTKFVKMAGKPRLSFVVDVSLSLCKVLDSCDALAKKNCEDCGSNSKWRPVVVRDDRYIKNQIVKL